MFCWIKNRFCGMKLRTAGMTIGWLSAVLSLIQSIIFTGVIVFFNTNSLTEHSALAISEDGKVRHNDGLGAAIQFGMTLFASVQLAMGLVDLVASILVIVGTIKKSHLMLLPWLINNAIVIVPRSFLFLFGIINAFSESAKPSEALLLVVVVVILVAHAWFWSGIFALYRNIRDSKKDVQSLSLQVPPKGYELFNNDSEGQVIKKF